MGKKESKNLNGENLIEEQIKASPDTKKAKEEEKGARKLTGYWKTIISGLCILMATFHLYVAGIGSIDDRYVVSIHLAFVLTLIYLIFPATNNSPKNKPSWVDIVLAGLGFSVGAYISVNLEKINLQMGQATTMDLFFGTMALLLVLEAARRSIGNALPILAIAFIAYALFGRSVPGAFQHIGYSMDEIIKILYITDEGLFGSALNTSATYVVLFIFFGAIMSEIGMSKFLNDFALSVAGWMVGGPAKVATLASGLMGSVSGSVSGNVATTGVMTIPLMKSVGYRPYYAGAVECVASAGGQIMPPVMGAAAFLMAQFLGKSYSIIVLAAIIPALIYYISVWAAVDLRARHQKLQTIPRDQIPSLFTTIKNYGYMAIPLVALIYLLVIKQYNPIYAAWLSIVLAAIISMVKPESRLTPAKLAIAFEKGCKGTLSVAIACACSGFVIGVISLTGVGLVFSMNIMELAFGVKLLALFFGMLASIILGMGLPTTACYIVTALTIAPALVNMGVEPMAAHFFVFYFSIMSTVTPPVALSAFVAAGLAGSSPTKTGFAAFRLALSGFIIPYMIVYKPELLIVGSSASSIIYSSFSAVLGVIMLAATNEGYLKGKLSILQRLMMAVGVFGLLILDWRGDIIAIPIVALIWFMQTRKSNLKMDEQPIIQK